MKQQISGIILATVRHSDRHNVTNIYTREFGRMAFLTPAGASKKSRQTASRLQPLSVVQAQVNILASRDLHLPSSILPLRVWRSIYYHPVKTSVAIFLSEFLNRLLREAPSDPMLWDYITDSLSLFDSLTDSTSIANFHICFLVGLTFITGIQPDLSDYTEGMEFDMKAGKPVTPFSRQSAHGMRISAGHTHFITKLVRINFANSRHFRFKGTERSELLEAIIKYYGCHFPGCDNLKSPEILKEIFS